MKIIRFASSESEPRLGVLGHDGDVIYELLGNPADYTVGIEIERLSSVTLRSG